MACFGNCNTCCDRPYDVQRLEEEATSPGIPGGRLGRLQVEARTMLKLAHESSCLYHTAIKISTYMPTDLCSLDTQRTCSLFVGSMPLDIINAMMCQSYSVGALGIEPWGPTNATNSGLRVKVTSRHCSAGANTPPSFLRLNEDNVTS